MIISVFLFIEFMSKRFIHFNNAGMGLPRKNIIKFVSSYLYNERRYGGYEFANRNKTKIKKFYTNLANLLNAKENEISFVSNTTLGWNLFFNSLSLTKKDEILIFENEYNSNYISILKRRKEIKRIVISKIDQHGLICEEDLKNKLSKNTKICSLQHISSQCGNKNKVEQICKIIKDFNPSIIILLDCCQSIGQVDIDVKKIDCDVIIGSGRKYLCGPRGTGFMYIKKYLKKKIDPIFEDMTTTFIDGKKIMAIENSRIFENFEQPIALKIGLSMAVEQILKFGVKKIEKKILSLSLYLRNELKKFKQIIFLECLNNLSGINTFYIKNIKTEYIFNILRKNSISTQISNQSVSYLYFKKNKIHEVIRVSLHYYNTKKEIDFFIKKIKNLLI